MFKKKNKLVVSTMMKKAVIAAIEISIEKLWKKVAATYNKQYDKKKYLLFGRLRTLGDTFTNIRKEHSREYKKLIAILNVNNIKDNDLSKAARENLRNIEQYWGERIV